MADISVIDPKFVHHYREFSCQNSLMMILVKDIQKISFILKISKKSFDTHSTHSDRFEPNPIKYFPLIYKDDILAKPLTLADISNFFRFFENMEDFFSFIRTGITSPDSTDDQLIAHFLSCPALDLNFVKLLYFFIFTNDISFSHVNIDKIYSGITLFKTSHGYEKEKEFYDIRTESKILFHGTSISNVYSIMRNGIKSMSGGKFQSNGAAYGSGVYLAHNFETAKGYGIERRFSSGLADMSNLSDDVCVLVFDCKNLNLKGGGFCYVQQENEIILRCIAVFPYNNIDSNLPKFLTSFATTESNSFRPVISYVPIAASSPVKETVTEPILKMVMERGEPGNDQAVITTTRFKAETERLFKLPLNTDEKTIIKVNFVNPNDKKSPLLILVSPDPDSLLYKDLVDNNIPGILLAVYFTEGYPIKQPKVRVVSPIFVEGTGRIGLGGSICADVLFSQGWSPANTIEKIVRALIINMAYEGSRNGVGRVDKRRLGKFYTYREYVNSHDFAAKSHATSGF